MVVTLVIRFAAQPGHIFTCDDQGTLRLCRAVETAGAWDLSVFLFFVGERLSVFFGKPSIFRDQS